MSTLDLPSLELLCPDVSPFVIKDFVHRMDPEYFEQFPLKTTALHIHLAEQLTAQKPCALHTHKDRRDLYSLHIVAYDYFSEFSSICGILSGFGFDIREAFIFTYTNHSTAQPSVKPSAHSLRTKRAWPHRPSATVPGLSKKKVVDVFRLQLLPGFSFSSKRQTELMTELTSVIQLLHINQFRQARNRVNRRLVETLGQLRSQATDFLHPVQIQFDNSCSSSETVLDIQSTDTPAFLYTFTNALAMRGLYIEKAKIEVKDTKVHNRLFIRGRHGGKIQNKKDQEELSAAAAIVKEFTHYLTWAPDPAKALEHFDQLLDQLLPEQKTLAWLKNKPVLSHLAQLFGSSDFLWEDFLRHQHSHLLPAMTSYQKGPLVRSKASLERDLRTQLAKAKNVKTRHSILNQFKDKELFRIDMKHLLEATPLPNFSYAITNLAEVILEQALKESLAIVRQRSPRPTLASGRPVPFSICGLGKFGGGEMGYASDIEVLFVYGTEEHLSSTPKGNPLEFFEYLVQEILRWIDAKHEGIFHIDTRLRPHGEKGLLANSLDEIQRYYSPQGMAAPFERQALIKLRHVAGDSNLGKKIETHRDTFVYSPQPWSLTTALALRDRQKIELVPKRKTHIKYSPGGIVDIEYLVQYLQIQYGATRPSLRTPNTLQALASLLRAKLLTKNQFSILQEDYLFFRNVIDALRMVRGNAQDLILPDPGSDPMIFLARRLGFMTQDWKTSAKALQQEIEHRMDRTHTLFLHLFRRRERRPKNT
jgi:glutamate-ammonia-ligase adenylyltransferase